MLTLDLLNMEQHSQALDQIVDRYEKVQFLIINATKTAIMHKIWKAHNQLDIS